MGSVSLEAKRRDQVGTAAARRLRRQGLVPAVIYGHGLESVSLTVSVEALYEVLHQKSHMISIVIDGATEQALIREVQYDALGDDIVHVDFGRVAADETIEIEVPLETHGTAKGVQEGGFLEQLLHTLAVSCRADAIPDSIRVEVGELKIGDSIRVGELSLPEGARAAADPATVVVVVHAPKEEEAVEEVAPPEAAAAEPEVIGRAKEEEPEEEA